MWDGATENANEKNEYGKKPAWIIELNERSSSQSVAMQKYSTNILWKPEWEKKEHLPF